MLGEGDLGLHLAGIGVEHVSESARCAVDGFAADEMPDLAHRVPPFLAAPTIAATIVVALIQSDSPARQTRKGVANSQTNRCRSPGSMGLFRPPKEQGPSALPRCHQPV